MEDILGTAQDRDNYQDNLGEEQGSALAWNSEENLAFFRPAFTVSKQSLMPGSEYSDWGSGRRAILSSTMLKIYKNSTAETREAWKAAFIRLEMHEQIAQMNDAGGLYANFSDFQTRYLNNKKEMDRAKRPPPKTALTLASEMLIKVSEMAARGAARRLSAFEQKLQELSGKERSRSDSSKLGAMLAKKMRAELFFESATGKKMLAEMRTKAAWVSARACGRERPNKDDYARAKLMVKSDILDQQVVSRTVALASVLNMRNTSPMLEGKPPATIVQVLTRSLAFEKEAIRAAKRAEKIAAEAAAPYVPIEDRFKNMTVDPMAIEFVRGMVNKDRFDKIKKLEEEIVSPYLEVFDQNEKIQDELKRKQIELEKLKSQKDPTDEQVEKLIRDKAALFDDNFLKVVTDGIKKLKVKQEKTLSSLILKVEEIKDFKPASDIEKSQFGLYGTASEGQLKLYINEGRTAMILEAGSKIKTVGIPSEITRLQVLSNEHQVYLSSLTNQKEAGKDDDISH